MRSKDSYKQELFNQVLQFNREFFGSKKSTGSVDPRLYEMIEKHGEDFSINYTAIVYKNLTGNGKAVAKNVPLSALLDGSGDKILIEEDVLALEIYAKGVRYDTKAGRLYPLGGNGDAGKLFAHKIVFGKKVDPKKLGYFQDAKVITKKEFAEKCKLADVVGYTVEDGVSPM